MMTLALLSTFAWLQANRRLPDPLLTQSEKIRIETRNSASRVAESLEERIVPIRKNMSEFFDKKKFDAAETACWQMYSLLSPAPFMQDEALFALADVYQAEGKDRQALNIWAPRSRTMGDGAFADMAISYANLDLADLATEFIQKWREYSHQRTEEFDMQDMPSDDSPTIGNLKATALFMRALSTASYAAGTVEPRKLQDLEEAYKLAPRNGNICYYLARFTKDGKAEQIRLYGEAYKYGGPVVKRPAGYFFKQLGGTLPDGSGR